MQTTNIDLLKLKRYVEYRLNDNKNLVDMLKGTDRVTFEGAQTETQARGAIKELSGVKSYINELLGD